MSLSSDATSKMEVCQKCGDKGDKKRLIHCIKCQVAAEHSYCFDTLPRKGDKNIIWICEECVPIETKPIPEPSIRSARISRAVENKWNRIKMLKQKGFAAVNAQPRLDAKRLTDSMQPKGDSSIFKEEIERLPLISGNEMHCLSQSLSLLSENAGNEESLKQKRRLVIEDDSSDEESESVECIIDDSPRVFHYVNEPVVAHPVVEPIWRGCLKLECNDKTGVIEVVGHLSTKSCEKVKNAIKEVPMMLNATIFHRADVWPWKLEDEWPTDECIGVYLFPENERDERLYDELMNEIIIHDQALKVVTKTLQLFVFSSRNLPPEHWRICQKYYLWGVFKSTRLSHDLTSQDGQEMA